MPLNRLLAELTIQKMMCEMRRAEADRKHDLFLRQLSAHEVQCMELRELRIDPDSAVEAIRVIERARKR